MSSSGCPGEPLDEPEREVIPRSRETTPVDAAATRIARGNYKGDAAAAAIGETVSVTWRRQRVEFRHSATSRSG
jgi:hypothetical protein